MTEFFNKIPFNEQDNKINKSQNSFKNSFYARLSCNSLKYDKNIKYYAIDLQEHEKKFGISFSRPKFKNSDDKYPSVISILEGSACSRYPIKENDQILKINGVDCTDLTFEEFISKTNDAITSKRLEILVKHRTNLSKKETSIINSQNSFKSFDNPNFKIEESYDNNYIDYLNKIDIQLVKECLKNISYYFKAFDNFILLNELNDFLSNDIIIKLIEFYNYLVESKTHNQYLSTKIDAVTEYNKIMQSNYMDHNVGFLKEALSNQNLISGISLYQKLQKNSKNINSFTVERTKTSIHRIVEPLSYRDTIKVIELERSDHREPFGITIKNESDSILIGRVVKESIADRSGSLRSNDEILEINDTSIKGTSIDDVLRTIEEIEENFLKLVIIPKSSYDMAVLEKSETIVIRSQFKYSPLTDPYIPCNEIGLAFNVGDILLILCKEDLKYWQAKNLNQTESRVGLIPSKLFRQQTEKIRIYLTNEREKIKKGCCSMQKNNNSILKIKSFNNFNQPDYWDRIEKIWTYEIMLKVAPDPFIRRPLILTGHSKCGRIEFRESLLKKFPNMLTTAIPHTIKHKSNHETETKTSGEFPCHYLSKKQFESMINDGVTQIVESGLVDGNNYAITHESIEQTIKTGKICILSLECESAYKLRIDGSLKPYVVLISINNDSKDQHINIDKYYGKNTLISAKDFLKILNESDEITETHKMWVDKTISNYDFDKTMSELEKIIDSMVTEQLWIPRDWIN